MLICRNAEWVHGQIKVGKPWFIASFLACISNKALLDGTFFIFWISNEAVSGYKHQNHETSYCNAQKQLLVLKIKFDDG